MYCIIILCTKALWVYFPHKCCSPGPHWNHWNPRICTVARFIVPDWGDRLSFYRLSFIDKVDSGIGLSYRLAILETAGVNFPPSQRLWVWLYRCAFYKLADITYSQCSIAGNVESFFLIWWQAKYVEIFAHLACIHAGNTGEEDNSYVVFK